MGWKGYPSWEAAYRRRAGGGEAGSRTGWGGEQRREIEGEKRPTTKYYSTIRCQLSSGSPMYIPACLLGFYQAMLTLPLTFLPKISPGQSHNIIIVLVKEVRTRSPACVPCRLM